MGIGIAAVGRQNDVHAAGRKIIFYQANRLANGRCYRANETIKQIPAVLSYMGNGTIILGGPAPSPRVHAPGDGPGLFWIFFQNAVYR